VVDDAAGMIDRTLPEQRAEPEFVEAVIREIQRGHDVVGGDGGGDGGALAAAAQAEFESNVREHVITL
jgi:hypothetical protein